MNMTLTKRDYRICTKCCMDTTDPEIIFDQEGVCNHCHDAQRELKLAWQEAGNLGYKLFDIKQDGMGKKYDCVIGLSGGVDSSMALYYAVKFGLRPLCFSVDNGWNTKESDENIMRLVEHFKVPFYRFVLDKKKFTELQSTFLTAGLINVEIPTDHILMAVTLQMAADNHIKWIISGGNVATESIMPASWSYSARDLTHIKAVYKSVTGKKLGDLPVCGLLKWNYFKWIKGIKTLYLLDYLKYNRNEAIKILEKLGYKSYGEKHCESLFTWWFQNYYLFQKFGIDKRKPHLSSEINSGAITREEALKELEKMPVYPQLDIKLNNRKASHYDFPTDKWFGRISKVIRALRC